MGCAARRLGGGAARCGAIEIEAPRRARICDNGYRNKPLTGYVFGRETRNVMGTVDFVITLGHVVGTLQEALTILLLV